MNIFSLKTELDKIFFINEEVEIYNKIDPKIIDNLKEIIIKINNKKIKFFYTDYKNSKNNSSVVSLLNNKFKNFYPLGHTNPWSNYNFFKDYFKFSNYNFNTDSFVKIHLEKKRYAKLGKINSLISFTPFFIERLIKEEDSLNLNFILKFIPKIRIKDKVFYKNLHFMNFYAYYLKKSKQIKQKFIYVHSALGDDASKKEYLTFFNGKIEECWLNYFNKAHHICQYGDYINLNNNSVVINCGVELGYELKLFNGVNKIYNIDPGTDKYLDKSLKYLLQKTKTKNYFLDYALYVDKDVYTSGEKNQKINITTLKKIIKNHKIDKIDLIKSDIQGAERYMVEDLIEICEKYNPQLAISIYHPNYERDSKIKHNEMLYDLVDIPSRLIEKLKDKYNFFCKHYSYQRYHCIFYAIPKNKYNEVRK